LNQWKYDQRKRLMVTTVIQSDEEKVSAVHGTRYNWEGYRFQDENGNSPQFQGPQRRIVRGRRTV
jgi:hypothetical protein